jgi:hypothetical protein
MNEVKSRLDILGNYEDLCTIKKMVESKHLVFDLDCIIQTPEFDNERDKAKWRKNNWGTKYHPSIINKMGYNINNSVLSYQFVFEDEIPFICIAKLSTMFPNVWFNVHSDYPYTNTRSISTFGKGRCTRVSVMTWSDSDFDMDAYNTAIKKVLKNDEQEGY